MQRITLLCVLISLFGSGINHTSAEGLPINGQKMVPIAISPAPLVTHATYYEPIETTSYSPLTTAASTPLGTPSASCCSPSHAAARSL